MDILQFYLVVSRGVNANASPDVPKPLYQWGPIDSELWLHHGARALRRRTAHAPFGDVQRTRPSADCSARALRRHKGWLLFNPTCYLTQEGTTPPLCLMLELRSNSGLASLDPQCQSCFGCSIAHARPAYTTRPLAH
jgi:hypothetical protein